MLATAGEMESGRKTIIRALTDFLEEGAALEAFLSGLDEGDWSRMTPFADWSIADVVRHLMSVDRDALFALTDENAFASASGALLRATASPVAGEPVEDPVFSRLRAYESQRIAMISSDELLDAWHVGRLELERTALAFATDEKIGWFGPPMRVSRLFGARQMEVWCYGQDIYDTFGTARPNTDRLRQIVDFGVRTRRYAFDINHISAPPPPFICLSGPNGDTWNWGEPLADERIDGTAEHFALVVTQRRNVADTALKVQGDGAAKWMMIAQTIAGGPVTPPPAGLRI
ncbi:MAG: maleylpyruvate isomerase family mycothiol-dependent enzyme [Sphingomonadales bacterium]|nr:maleylpyruvate isomerase family mycothiol-dependent enzyme [Sphingomonadales bacterium]